MNLSKDFVDAVSLDSMHKDTLKRASDTHASYGSSYMVLVCIDGTERQIAQMEKENASHFQIMKLRNQLAILIKSYNDLLEAL